MALNAATSRFATRRDFSLSSSKLKKLAPLIPSRRASPSDKFRWRNSEEPRTGRRRAFW